jgi:hypothetical protein
MQRVFKTSLLLLHLCLGRDADANHGDPACQLRQTLLELLLIVVGFPRRRFRVALL